VRLDKRQDVLVGLLKQKDEELDQIEEIIKDKENAIRELERQLNEKVEAPPPPKPEPPKRELYKAVKGDLVDELLAKYINKMGIPIPIKRLGDGYYLFGTKKILAKIMNGKLVIRVGGGYMSIEEFIAQYAEPELIKVNQLKEKGLSPWDDPEYQGGVNSPNSKSLS